VAALKRRPSHTVATTARPTPRLDSATGWPWIGQANSIAKNGCSSCTWLMRTASPRASARYQAKKASHIENRLT